MTVIKAIIDAFDYIRKQTNAYAGIVVVGGQRAYDTGFSEKSIKNLAKKNYWDYENALSDDGVDFGVELKHLNGYVYELQTGDSFPVFILAHTYTQSLYEMIPKELSKKVTNELINTALEFHRKYRDTNEKTFFNGVNENEDVTQRIKNFNKHRYNMSQSPKNIPMQYRAHRTTPKHKTCGIRSLENSVRKMF